MDWTIEVTFKDFIKPLEDGEPLVGVCDAQHTINCAYIEILNDKEILNRSTNQKMSQEVALIHELLHCKYLLFEHSKSSIPDIQYGVSQHALIEQMAKSLFMAKYDLVFDWFSV